MVEPEKLAAGIWKCPICGFTAMSKKVIENHMQREHGVKPSAQPSQNEVKVTEQPRENENKKPKNDKGENGKERVKDGEKKKEKGKKWAKFKIGDTKIKVLKRPEIEIRDQRGWQFFLTANYVASLHKQKVRVKLVNGEEFEGVLKARDPYFVTLKMEGGRKLIINKAHILYIEPL